MRIRLYLTILLIVDVALLLYGVSTLSISYKEAVIFYDDRNFLHYLVTASTALFGQNDYALRLPFILFHIGSVILLYLISKIYLKRMSDQLLAVGTFILLPGVVSSALLVNSASISIFFTLLFVWLFLHKQTLWYLILLPCLLFIDNSFMVLYLGIFTYGIYTKNKKIALFSGILFLFALAIYGFQMGGKPKGYILDVLGAYSIIFSPLVFLYFFYTLYRILMKERKDIVWFISFTALLFSILISYRQRILIDDFAPYVLISVPLMIKMFMTSYRIRLPELRTGHKFLFICAFMMLILNFIATYTYQYAYLLLDKPHKHFAYKYNIAKDLAQALKRIGITKVQTDPNLQKRLQFYGIDKGYMYALREKPSVNTFQKVTISYVNKPIKIYYITNIHK